MRLRTRVIITSVLVALPASAVVLWTIESVRARDTEIALRRVVEAHLTESVRDQCQTDPMWFLAGPRVGRPSLAARARPDADVLLPRPSAEQLPFEVFAYDAQFSPTSTAGPRFPADFRDAMRASPPAEVMVAPWDSEVGEGLQIARLTGWTAGPCAVLLFRLQPPPGLALQRVWLFAGLFTMFFAAMLAAFSPTLFRVRRTSLAIGRAARDQYASVAPDTAKDEISAVAFVFNDAATEIHRRGAEIKDRSEALRRLGDQTAESVARPLAELESRLAGFIGREALPPEARRQAGDLLQDLHEAAVRLENLAAASTLRANASPLAREVTDVGDLTRRVIARYAPLAGAAGVSLAIEAPGAPVQAPVSPLLERALGNLLDNAIRHSAAGGRVTVTLSASDVLAASTAPDAPDAPDAPGAPGAWSIRVTDTGAGVTDDQFKGLTAIRRFRGDESRNPRPNVPGLGLAVAREIADRSGLDLRLRRPPDGGFEAELRTA